MKRSEARIEYTWDMSHIFRDKLEWEKTFAQTNHRISEIAKYKGKLVNPEMALRLFRLTDEVGLAVEKLYVYANMCMHVDGANAEAVALAQRANTISASFSAACSYIDPELTTLTDEQLDFMIDHDSFADYNYMLERVKKSKPHVLGEKEEYILARMSEVTGSFRDIFSKIDNVDLPHPLVKVGDERIPLTHGTYARMLQNQDGAVRKKAFKTYYALYEERINTIATCYANSVKKNNIITSLRGYDDAMSASMEADDVPSGVYDKLIEAVNDALPTLHEYVDYRRLVLGDLHMYDMYVPLVPGADLGTDYENAFKIVTDALGVLGSDYVEALNRMKKERRIDVMENEGKRGGAYSWGAYGSGPYVLLNYAGTTHDVFTIAHELGHAMHSQYADNALCYNKAGYSIFVAEVASTTNEVLLLKHLIATTKDKNVKKYLLSYYLDMFRTTLFRQTMFAEFEQFAHKSEKKGVPLTVETLSKAYLKLNKKYYGSGVTHDKQIRYEWARIPHFYNAFYVYKYATGLTAAVTLANAILGEGEPAKRRYFEKFLSAGGRKSPYEILKDAGVDLLTDRPYQVAMLEFSSTLSEFTSL
ncbi:MAG: oligoendopeptidase F [Clostridia bacterium]|nr:oligoendopeptidase F [Clostridia bacterium]